MKNLFKVLSLAAWVAVMFASCQKEEQMPSQAKEDGIVRSGLHTEPAVINGKTMLFQKSKSQKKGVIAGETDWIEEQIIKDYPYDATANEYRVIKVNRPNGRYFWIMIDNFKYNAGAGSYVYENKSFNVATYGRLYNWQTAQDNRTKISMKLPRIKNGVESKPIFTVFGRLPNFQDIKDLLETSTIGNLPSNGTDVYNGWDMYYDAFLAGREDSELDFTKAYPTLAGWRDNMEVVPGNREFNSLTQWGRFWTAEQSSSSDAHYPLEILDDKELWTAYVNAGHANGYSFSVRYVFEPIYR